MSRPYPRNSFSFFPVSEGGFEEGSGDGGRRFFSEEDTSEPRFPNMRPNTVPDENIGDGMKTEPVEETTAKIFRESDSISSSTAMFEEPETSTSILSTTSRNEGFSEREKVILISTLVPAVTIILILSLFLAYFIFKRHRNSRVGTEEVKEVQEAQGGSNGWTANNGRPQTSHSTQGANGTHNGAARAWESQEIAAQHETDSC